MKNIAALIRKAFFYGALALSVLVAVQKIAKSFGYTLWHKIPDTSQLLEFAVIALLFSIAMQLREVSILLSSESPDLNKK